MCGICGTFAYGQGEAVNPAVGRAIRDRMAARGPDGCGEWRSLAGGVWLGHRRLAIIDLSPAGAQPMQSEDGKLVLSFNGEIYNHEELRNRLTAQGCTFRSASD